MQYISPEWNWPLQAIDYFKLIVKYCLNIPFYENGQFESKIIPWRLLCYSPDPRTNIRSILLRDDTDYKENMEIRRVFVHPSFEFPSLYKDIAVAELGKNCGKYML